MKTGQAELILASASAARIGMLRAAGLAFKIVPADIDENSILATMVRQKNSASDIALRLSEAKALEISKSYPSALVIGSDQILEFEGDILQKSADREAAKIKLLKMRGKAHRLISAVCVVRQGEVLWNFLQEAHLKMHDFDHDFAARYMERAEDALTKCVGGYEIEGAGAALFESVEGNHFTIMGMPLLPLLNYLRDQHRIEP
jgi:septum formation protein